MLAPDVDVYELGLCTRPVYGYSLASSIEDIESPGPPM